MEQKDAINQSMIYEEDEIDLREIFHVIARYKIWIMAFVFFVVSGVTVYLLSIPNVYQSKAVLVPQEEKGSPSLGGLSALAGMAGVSLGQEGVDTFTSLKTILEDYEFERYMIEKYDLINRLDDENLSKDFVFAFGFDGVYRFFHSKEKEKDKSEDKEAALFGAYRRLKDSIFLSSDKRSGVITLAVNHPNRFFAKRLADIYLTELTNRLREIEMKDIDKKISYYEKALESTNNIELRKNLSQLISSLIQKRVLAKSSKYYKVMPITMPTVPNIKDKVKPKRGLILVASFIISIFIAIFWVFLIEFFKKGTSTPTDSTMDDETDA